MHRIIVDTDAAMGGPGSDAAGFSLAVATNLADQRLELVTTVNGATDVDTSTLLALDLLHRLGRSDIPVVKGARAPLLRAVHDHPARDRIAEVRKRLSRYSPAPGRAATAIVEHIMANPGEVTLVVIGPLTNIAVAIALEPAITAAVKQIIVTGGVFLRTTSVLSMPGEFNIWADPEAAAIVLNSGAPLRFIGLDVTLQAHLDPADVSRYEATGRPGASYADRCAHAWIDQLRTSYPGAGFDSASVHGPLAVAVVSHSQLVTWRPARVEVECSSTITRGVTVADLLDEQHPPQPNCLIATEVDSPAVIDFVLNHVHSRGAPLAC